MKSASARAVAARRATVVIDTDRENATDTAVANHDPPRGRAGQGERSLLEKFETLALEAHFAVVLLSADDLGVSRRQFEAVDHDPVRTLKFRARDNVILELGCFYGRLGWERVFVLSKPAAKPWPDFERPSDLAGAVLTEISDDLDWHADLASRLTEAGFQLR